MEKQSNPDALDRALTDLMIGWSRRAPEQAAEWLQQRHSGLQLIHLR